MYRKCICVVCILIMVFLFAERNYTLNINIDNKISVTNCASVEFTADGSKNYTEPDDTLIESETVDYRCSIPSRGG